jgi:hypothetical protein
MLFPKAILDAERAADAPLREAMAIKRERLRALRAKRAATRYHWHLGNYGIFGAAPTSHVGARALVGGSPPRLLQPGPALD